jgi:hypothetical protein
MKRLCEVCNGVYANNHSFKEHQRQTGHKPKEFNHLKKEEPITTILSDEAEWYERFDALLKEIGLNVPKPEPFVDVVLQDFYSLLETRGVNKAVIQSNIMKQGFDIVPLLAQAYDKLQNRQGYATSVNRHTFIFPSGPAV